MHVPLLATKLQPPRLRPDMVPRPRLIKLLEAGLHRKLTLVAAPAGFGKTTLISEWVSGYSPKNNGLENIQPSQNAPQTKVAWLSLDPSDNTLTRFLSLVIAALQTAQPGLGESAQALLHSSPAPPVEVILTILINDLNNWRATNTFSRLILVLDDYHEIDEDEIHAAVNFLLDHQPANLHLVLNTRSDPPLPLARLRARAEMTEIRLAELRFTPSEAADFLNQAMALSLTAENLAILESRTEGWIAGLQLAAIALQGQPDQARFFETFAGTSQFIFDYLVEEILQRQSPEIQTFLLQTSLLDRLTAPLCDAVTGSTGSADILNKLHKSNLFITPLDDRREWYRYHRLFRDVLQTRLQSAFPERLADIHRCAGEWYALNGLIDDAINHLLAAGDVDRAAEVVEQNAWSSYDQGDFYTVRGWMNRLSGSLVRTRPWLILIQGTILLFTGRLEEVDHLLAESAALLDDPTHSEAFKGELAQICATRLRFNQDPDQTIEYARQALSLLPAERHGSRASALVNLLLAYMQRGEMAAIDGILAQLESESEFGFPPALLGAIQGAAWVQARQGRLHRSMQLYRNGLERVKDIHPRPFVFLGLAHYGLGEIFYELDDLPIAEAHLRDCLDYLGCSIEQVAMAYAAGALALILVIKGNILAAHAALDEAQAWFTRMQLNDLGFTTVLASQRALLSLRQGQLPSAVRWVEACGSPLDKPFSYLQLRESLIIARIYLAQNRPAAALAVLEPLQATVEALGWNGQMIEILCLEALAHQTMGQREKALDCLARALEPAAGEGFIRVFLDEGEPMERLLQTAYTRGVGGSHRDYLLAKFAAASSRPSDAMLPEPISEREIEVLRFVAEGLSNQQIADALVIALPTVKKHISNILVKLDVSSRTQAIARARDLGLI